MPRGWPSSVTACGFSAEKKTQTVNVPVRHDAADPGVQALVIIAVKGRPSLRMPVCEPEARFFPIS
jgi:hypothetical protein